MPPFLLIFSIYEKKLEKAISHLVHCSLVLSAVLASCCCTDLLTYLLHAAESFLRRYYYYY